jgi:D-3-phosphoglycerate dehydrogenase / 2-oxoglutarate reductase
MRRMGARKKALLVENIHPSAIELLTQAGFEVETTKTALKAEEMSARLAGVQLLGIRSKTQVAKEALENAKDLIALGCFCIGTNQVDLDSANRLGIPVFNAPFSNTRSVAELIIAEIVALSRQLGDRSREVHEGKWRKVSAGCFEVRGKTLGIVGYGHIGSQVGVLAEAMGLRVLFFDIATKLPMGNNRSLPNLGDLLEQSDFVTLHVPATPETSRMIGAAELGKMKAGSYLLNASRGTVVDIGALADAIKRGHVAGAAVDVYPEEPEGQSDEFVSPLRNLPNVILTPHIGGSTEEAQEMIGREVATSLVKLAIAGTTTSSVNFPAVETPLAKGMLRILNVHKNVPGVLGDVNRIVSARGGNIRGQVLATDARVGYLVMDLELPTNGESDAVAHAVADDIAKLKTNIRTRTVDTDP